MKINKHLNKPNLAFPQIHSVGQIWGVKKFVIILDTEIWALAYFFPVWYVILLF